MANLIEFLLGNVFYLVLLFWFLAGIFNKKREPQDDHTPSPQRAPRPTAGPIEIPWETVGDRENTNQRPQQQREGTKASSALDDQRRRNQESPKQTEAQRRYEELRSANTTVDSAVSDMAVTDQIGDLEEMTETLRSEAEYYSKKAKDILDFKHMGKKSVTQGIVWSQILGPPRSRDPHRTNRYQVRRHSQ
ncbi:hypothetical protein [Caldalkalibacillus salinus]|uniref:hypothetical protein n=1 Tax=Caldalkalibacillus salinus TaxID=2803787 RepID=UPI0019247E81|nr:hypothetical protein [Caldalkalibacillus salinus]